MYIGTKNHGDVKLLPENWNEKAYALPSTIVEIDEEKFTNRKIEVRTSKTANGSHKVRARYI